MQTAINLSIPAERVSASLGLLDLAGLSPLMELSAGRAEIVIGLIDGPVAGRHSGLANANIRELPGRVGGVCSDATSLACTHGTFIAGILMARDRSVAPAICPDCTFLVRPIFRETNPSPRYLARDMCWIFTIEGLETYILRPRDPADFALLVEALRPAPSPLDLDVIVGLRGPIAPPWLCNGLMLPLVAFDQVYSFDRDALIKSIPRPEKGAKEFAAAAAELFDRVAQLADNAGATDEHRALNYCVVRYPAIYTATAEAYQRNAALSGLEVRASRLSGARNIVDVILSFTNRNTDVTEKYFTRVDVTEKFPFLVTKLSPYFDR